MRLAAGVQPPGGGAERVDGLGDEAGVPGLARPLPLLLPLAGARGLHHAPIGPGQAGQAQPRARQRGPVGPLAHQVRLGRGLPVLPEVRRHPRDRRRHPVQHRRAVRRQVDRRGEHVGDGPGPPALHQQRPRPEGAGHGRREQAGAGDVVQAEALEHLRGGRGRCDTLPAHHLHGRAGGLEDDRDLARRAVEVRLDDLQGEAGRGGRVEGVAAALEHGLPDRGGQPVRAGHHAEGSGELGTGRGQAGRQGTHDGDRAARLPGGRAEAQAATGLRKSSQAGSRCSAPLTTHAAPRGA